MRPPSFLQQGALWLLYPILCEHYPELLCALPHLQDDLEPLALAPAPAPRPPQDLIGLRLAQEKALKRQLEEEQKLKPGGAGVPVVASSSSSSSARPGPAPAEETMDFREEGPECETPAIFISMDDDSGLTEAALLDSSLEGPLPKVGVAIRDAMEESKPGGEVCAKPGSGGHEGFGGATRLLMYCSLLSATRRQQQAG